MQESSKQLSKLPGVSVTYYLKGNNVALPHQYQEENTRVTIAKGKTVSLSNWLRMLSTNWNLIISNR